MIPSRSHLSTKSIVTIQKQLISKSLKSYEPTTWKLLIFDSHVRSLVSSQFKMKDLRDHNITLYLNIQQNRQQLHGVTVIYLVSPNLKNAEIIANDIIGDKYTSVVIHFTGQPSPNVLSFLAKTISQKKPQFISRISKIEYSSLGYYPIDDGMCVAPSAQELTNLITSLQIKPIFVFHGQNDICKQLVEDVKNKIASSSCVDDSSSKTKSYGLIYFFTRDNDQFPVLSHGITYASLLENIFEVSELGNKVKTSNNISSQLSLSDQIWYRKKNFLISEMELQKQSNKIKSKLMALSADQYSELNEKAKKVEWHIDNAEQMIKQAKKRRLKEFHEIQMEIYSKKHLSKQNYQDLFQILKQGPNEIDKIRIMIIYIQNIDSIDEIDELESVFPEIKKNHKYSEMKKKRLAGTPVMSASNKYIKKFAKGIWKNFISGDSKFLITKQYQKIKSAGLNELIESGLNVETIEPLPNNFSSMKITQNIVYVVGGLCFHEYANLAEIDSEAIYCGDKLINFRDFI